MTGTQWDAIAKPILDLVALLEPDNHAIRSDHLATRLGLEHGDVVRQLRSLIYDQFIDGDVVEEMGSRLAVVHDIELLPRGRRAVGEWPGEPGEEFIKRLDRLIAAEDDPDDREKLTGLRKAAKLVSTAVLSGVVEGAAQGIM